MQGRLIKRSNRLILPVLIVLVIYLIIGMAGIIRLQRNEDKESITVEETDRDIIDMLMNNTYINNDTKEEVKNAYFTYITILKDYIKSSGIILNNAQSSKLQEIVKEMKAIMKYDGESDFTKLSLDARGLVLKLSKKIYSVYGLNLALNLNGEIEEVSDLNGNVIYENDHQILHTNFHLNFFILVVAVNTVLFVMIIMIVKKKHLFKKEVDYDGFDEKRYA